MYEWTIYASPPVSEVQRGVGDEPPILLTKHGVMNYWFYLRQIAKVTMLIYNYLTVYTHKLF